MSKKSIRFLTTVRYVPFWDEERNKWWFSATDIVRAINDEEDYTKCRNYWKYLKGKFRKESIELVTLFAYRKYADLDRQERIYACYQHACLKYVTNDKMTNLTLRERLGIDKQNYPMASRIIKDTLIAGKIKEEKTENQSRNNKGYVPFWA